MDFDDEDHDIHDSAVDGLSLDYFYTPVGEEAGAGDDDDDDDGDYQDEGDGDEIEEDEDEDEDEEGNDIDEEDMEVDTGAAGAPSTDTDDARTGRTFPGYLTHRQLLLLLRGQDLSHVLFNDGDDDFDGWHRRRTPRRRDSKRFPKVPSDQGRELMESGTFGSYERAATSPGGGGGSKRRLALRILDRELGIGGRGFQKVNQALMAQNMIPTSQAEMVIRFGDPVYSGQFSDDGNFFFCCVKDFRVRMYDTSNPHVWRHYKTCAHSSGRATLTDASLSPDNKWLVYCSLQPRVCLAPTDPSDTGDPYTLDLSSDMARPRYGWGDGPRSFGIFSVRFSGDGRELVAGTNDSSIVVFDIESRTVLHHVTGHEDDINAVCFADKMSPHIVYSGSDDATLKVWDRRSMSSGREAGAFVGHCEGLTYIDSKGDGRYILSNSKDQTMKLWDLRMAMSSTQFAERDPMQHTRGSDFDYRWNHYDPDDWFKHPDDNSLVTFRGHRVQRTLIRCHFSPPGSTDSRYVYSGSHDGKVYVWNLDATLAATIDVGEGSSQAAPHRRNDDRARWLTCVREAYWHPNAPVLVASALNGPNMDFGTCSLHSFNEGKDDEAEPKLGRHVDEKLQEMVSPPVSQRHRNFFL